MVLIMFNNVVLRTVDTDVLTLISFRYFRYFADQYDISNVFVHFGSSDKTKYFDVNAICLMFRKLVYKALLL